MTESATGRQCLPCTACCEGWVTGDILGHRMRPGHPCPHSTAGGCGIYADRPEHPCRSFVCSWLIEGSPLPDWMRPDRSGAIVLLSREWEGEHLVWAMPVGKSIPERTLDWLKDYAKRHERPLVFYERIGSEDGWAGLRRFGFGSPAFRDKVARLAGGGSLDDLRLFAASEPKR